MLVRPPNTPGQWSEARALVTGYGASLGIDLAFQDFAAELRDLEGRYAPPLGQLLLGVQNDEPAGIVGVRRLDDDTCEMKRLFVRPKFRGRGFGRILAMSALDEGRALGYRAMRLDTLATMTSARMLYASLGFEEIDPYRLNPHPGTSYMEARLDGDEDEWYMRVVWPLLETAYLSEDDPIRQSGHRGPHERWTAKRKVVADAIDRDATFLDIGCANGYLMESVRGWALERGITVQLHGLDIAPGLVDLARARLPRWADRIHLGNALDWMPPQRYGFVATCLEYVPTMRRRDLVARLLTDVVEPGGRLLVCFYSDPRATEQIEQLREWGFTIDGFLVGADVTEDPSPPTVVVRLVPTT